MERILLIDDDLELCSLIASLLEEEAFVVDTVHDGQQGAMQALTGDYALVILDVMLPGLNGFEALRRIRSSGDAHANVPVVMLTARGEEVDRVVGLEIGADDYLPKPFSPRELVARIRAILRRTHSPVVSSSTSAVSVNSAHQTSVSDSAETQFTTHKRERIQIGDVELDTGPHVVRRKNEVIDLTAIEFDLLRALLQQAGCVMTREEIANDVLGRKLMRFDRTIDMHMSNLRRKLGPYDNGAERISTVRRVGYMYALPSED